NSSLFCFFFSSRRRHTRCYRDWSSDVCSSDLEFRSRRRRLFELRWQATRLRERPVFCSLLLVLAANVVVFWSLAAAATSGHLGLVRLVTFASAAVSTSMIAFGGLSWALYSAAAPAAAVLRLPVTMAEGGALRAVARRVG